jgi:hypothetical protein
LWWTLGRAHWQWYKPNMGLGRTVTCHWLARRDKQAQAALAHPLGPRGKLGQGDPGAGARGADDSAAHTAVVAVVR